MKWKALYTTLAANVTVRLPHPQREDKQWQEMFLAPSDDNQTCNYDTDSSKHHASLSRLIPKELSYSIYLFI